MSAQRVLNDLAYYLSVGGISMLTDEEGRVFVKDSTGWLLVYIGQVLPRKEDAIEA